MFQIPAPLLAQIREHAALTYPDECCGIIIGLLDGGIRKAAEVRRASNLNVERSRDRYLMDPKDQLEAEKTARAKGLQVVGYYHSHPDHPALASSTDSELSWENLSYFILSVREGKPAEAGCFSRASSKSELVSEEWAVI